MCQLQLETHTKKHASCEDWSRTRNTINKTLATVGQKTQAEMRKNDQIKTDRSCCMTFPSKRETGRVTDSVLETRLCEPGRFSVWRVL